MAQKHHWHTQQGLIIRFGGNVHSAIMNGKQLLTIEQEALDAQNVNMISFDNIIKPIYKYKEELK